MITQSLDYSDGDTKLEAYVAFEAAEMQKPLVLIAHDWTGRREFACQAAERIAAMGYVGLALDMYGKGVFGADEDTDGNAALMGPFAEDRSLLRQRIRAALVAGRNIPQVDPTRVAAIGYCFGGMCALEFRSCTLTLVLRIQTVPRCSRRTRRLPACWLPASRACWPISNLIRGRILVVVGCCGLQHKLPQGPERPTRT